MILKKFIRASSTLIILFLVLSLTSFATIQDDVYNLSKGVEYLDKTFVYEVENPNNGNKVLALCAEKDAPTYDVKKGLMTWVDYKVYNLEEIFDEDVSKQVRAIINEVGPQRDKETVVKEMKEKTGLYELTYGEIVSAMQHAIWFYTNGLLEIPTTENGEALYRLLVTLPPAENNLKKDVVNIVLDSIERNDELGLIIMNYHYNSDVPAKLAHVYSKNIITTYNAKESVTVENGVTRVKIELPIITEEMTLDFDITVKGSLDSADVVTAFVPDERGESQMLVGLNKLENTIAVKNMSQRLYYKSYRLILKDEEDVTRNGFTDGRFVTVSEINDINQVGREDKIFIGWFDENDIIVTSGVVMDSNRILHAVYKSKSSTTNPDKGSTDGGSTGGGSTDGGSTGGGSTDGGSTDGGSTGGGSTDGGSTDGGSTDGSSTDGSPTNGNTPTDMTNTTDSSSPGELIPGDPNESEKEIPLAEEKTPEGIPGTGWIPKTGGIPILVFLLVGSISVSVGIMLRRRKRKGL